MKYKNGKRRKKNEKWKFKRKIIINYKYVDYLLLLYNIIYK